MGAALKFNDVFAKGQPSAGGVHVTTALGNQSPGKSRFRAFLGSKVDDTAQVLDSQTKRDKEPTEPRALKPLDADTAHTPFPYDAQALDKLRPDQVPRFLGALTDPDRLPTKTMPHTDLTAMQNRVDPKKVEAMRGKTDKKPPTVVRHSGRNYIADGHHRIAADHLDGKDESKVRFLDLSPVSNALKRDDTVRSANWSLPLVVTKTDPDQQMIFGWASVVTRDGMMIIDKQGDGIPIAELESAVYKYCLESRSGDDMHARMNTSRMIESMVFTKAKCDALGMALPNGQEGWWVGYKVDDAALWSDIKAGNRPEFSIGGAAVPVEIVA